MTSTIDILRNTINNSNLSDENKQTYLNKINTTTTTNSASTVRNIISNPVINTTMANLGFNPSSIMMDTYKPAFSFKAKENTQQETQIDNTPPKLVNKQNIKNAFIITKEQEIGINKKGKQEIIHSSINIVKKAEKYKKYNEKQIPINQNQPFKFSDETILLNEKLGNAKIPFSKKLIQSNKKE
jgi:hypothetical protein